jgi:hypothetical protein
MYHFLAIKQNTSMQGRTYVDSAGVMGHRVVICRTKKILYARGGIAVHKVGGHPVENLQDTGAERNSQHVSTTSQQTHF